MSIFKLRIVFRWFESAEHELDAADVNLGLAGLGEALILLGVDAIASQPGEGAFDHPTLG